MHRAAVMIVSKFIISHKAINGSANEISKNRRKSWGNDIDFEQDSIETNFSHIMIQKNPTPLIYNGTSNLNTESKLPRNKHRKSSGYDSLDGDEESSSLDSAASNHNKKGSLSIVNNISNQQTTGFLENEKFHKESNSSNLNHLNNKNAQKALNNKNASGRSGSVFKRFLSKHPSGTKNHGFKFETPCIVEETIISSEGRKQSSDINDQRRIQSLNGKNMINKDTKELMAKRPIDMEIIQYDEMDIIRMDIRSKQASSSSTTTSTATNHSHSSAYSSNS